MSLIIGRTFRGGAVLAADTLHTETVVGHPLLDFGMVGEKIYPLSDNIIWGGSGGGGLTQRVKQDLDAWAAQNAGRLNRSGNELCPDLARVILTTVKQAFAESPFKDRPEAAPDALKNNFLLVGQDRNDAIWMLEAEWHGGRTRYESRGFHAIGSARIYAYASHGMLQHYRLEECDSQSGLVCTYRILHFAVKAAAGGVREPYTIYVLENRQNRLLENTEVDSLRDTVRLWLEREKESLAPPGTVVTESEGVRPGRESGNQQ